LQQNLIAIESVRTFHWIHLVWDSSFRKHLFQSKLNEKQIWRCSTAK